MASWTSLLSSWANKALSTTRLNNFLSDSGNMQWLKDMLFAKDGGELTISSGSITSTGASAYFTVDTESDAATDDLTTIGGGTEGDIIILSPASDARTVVIKDGDGNIITGGFKDISLDEIDKYVILRYDGSNWVVIASNVGTAKFVFMYEPIAHNALLTTGDGIGYMTLPQEMAGHNIKSIHNGVYTPSTSGLPKFQYRHMRHDEDILSTEVTIDVNEYNSYDAAAQPAVDTDYDDVQAGDRVRIDCDVSGTGTKGLAVFVTTEKV